MKHRLHRPALTLLAMLALAACGGTDDTKVQGGAGGDGGGSGGGGTGGDTTSTGGSGGGTGGQGQGGGGEGGGAPQTGPIVAPNEEWTWVDFKDAYCGNGESTGIAVNLSDKSKDVVIYFQGGGACWDASSCNANLAVHINDGYTEETFQAEKGQYNVPAFSRTGDSPFKDASLIFVPYCTGDVHAGDRVADYGNKTVHHVGGANFQKYLARLVETFPEAGHVLVTGSSAGGYGAGINYWRVREAFPEAKVDMLDDSGPPLPKPYLSAELQTKWMNAWDLAKAVPPDCADCKTDLDKIFDYYGKNYADSRFGLLSYTKDSVISFFLSVSAADMPDALDALAAADIDPHDNMHYFYVTGNSHTFLGGSLAEKTNEVTLKTWISQLWSGDPAWTSQKP